MFRLFCLIGTVLAAIISFQANHSVVWAVVHGFLGWAYVSYYSYVYILHMGQPIRIDALETVAEFFSSAANYLMGLIPKTK